MARRYIIATGTMSNEQEQALLAHIKEKKLGWWHWLPNFWLILDRVNGVDAGALRDKINQIAPGVSCLVMEIHEDITWASMAGKDMSSEKLTKWLKETWPLNS